MMASFILPRIGKNSFDDDAVRAIQRDYGADLLDYNKDKQHIGLFQEFDPNFSSWNEMDRTRAWVEDTTIDKEALWRK